MPASSIIPINRQDALSKRLSGPLPSTTGTIPRVGTPTNMINNMDNFQQASSFGSIGTNQRTPEPNVSTTPNSSTKTLSNNKSKQTSPQVNSPGIYLSLYLHL
jgi:hypothetical protein